MPKIVELWDRINPRVPSGNTPGDSAAKGFLYPWHSDNADMDRICQFLESTSPRLVVETGTFEAVGTQKMALALSRTTNPVVLLTFDYGKAPASLGESYGVIPGVNTVDAEGKFVDITKFDDPSWKSFNDVIVMRNQRLLSDYRNVKVVYIEGDTKDTLFPTLRNVGGYFDFWFQDSCHDLEGVLIEWNIMRPFSKVGSVVVFDDILPTHAMGRELISLFENIDDWVILLSETGHGQLWAERVK